MHIKSFGLKLQTSKDSHLDRFLKTFGFNTYGIVCILPQIAIDIRRIRDFGKDWKWIFINLIPVFGWVLWFIWLGFGKTGNGKNRLI